MVFPYTMRALKDWEKDKDDVKLGVKLATVETISNIGRKEKLPRNKKGEPVVYLKEPDKIVWW